MASLIRLTSFLRKGKKSPFLRKKNFNEGDRVVITILGDRNCFGTICGKSKEDMVDTYIVKLDDPKLLNLKYSCTTVPETFLEFVRKPFYSPRVIPNQKDDDPDMDPDEGKLILEKF